MSSICLYAELLQHIRSVTFYASLQTEYNHETKVHLSADNEWITLSHEGQNASIRLPTKVGGGGDASLTLPAAPSKDITLRLQLEETSPGFLQFQDHETGNIEPWTAGMLGEETEIYCYQCGQPFVSRGRVRTWKDLPSENWAEMMEFWHCHKPTIEHADGHEDVAARKGYAASNKLMVSSRTGFVDTSHVLLAPTDCVNIEAKKVRILSHSPSAHPSSDNILMATRTVKKEGLLDLKITTAFPLIQLSKIEPGAVGRCILCVPQGKHDGLLRAVVILSLRFTASFLSYRTSEMQ